MNKRGVLTAAVAATAAVAGAGFAWWRFLPQAATTDAVEQLWSQVFDDPNGQPVAMSSFKGQTLLVNFWATWCPPCVEELPLLNAFYHEQRAKGWNVVGLAIDQPSAVREFMQRLPLDFPVGMAGLAGTDLSRDLGNPRGALPFTVVISPTGDIAHRKIGQVYPADLATWIQG